MLSNMDMYPGRETGPESSDKDDEETKKAKAQRLGALSQFSFEKEKAKDYMDDDEDDKKEKRRQKKAEAKKDESEPAKKQAEEEPKHSDEAKAETEEVQNDSETESNEAIESAKRAALKQQLEENIPKLEQEVADAVPETHEHAAARAALEVERNLQQKAEDPDLVVDTAIDAEFNRRMDEIPEEEFADFMEQPEAAEPAEEPHATEDLHIDEDVPLTSTASPAGTAGRTSHTTPPPSPPPRTPHSTAPSSGATPPPASSSGQSGGANPPPPFRPGSYEQSGFGTTPPTANTAANFANAAPNTYRPLDRKSEKSKRAGAFLAGGVIGYMVGRRGGRKRTEARLEPQLAELKKESARTKEHLQQREAELREAVSNSPQERQPVAASAERAVQPKVAEVLQRRTKETSAKEILRQTVVRAETPAVTQPEVPLQRNNEALPPLPPILEKPTSPTSIPEARPLNQKMAEQVAPQPEVLIRKVEQLSTPDILRQAEHLFINGTSVKELYNTNQIDRTGLIAIVQESIRGGSLKDVFEKVELGKERQSERAREFRHDDPAFSAADSTSTAMPSANQPVSPLGVPNNPDPSSLQPLSSAPVGFGANNQAHEVPTQLAKPETASPDTSRSTAQIAGLAILAIGLALALVWFLYSL